MPSVAEELAALKKRNLTKNFAGKLKGADGLSTPEQEQASIERTNKTNRVSLYSKEAKKNLNAGTKAVDQDLAFKQRQIAQKKEDMQKKQEAESNLKSFNTAKISTPTKPKRANAEDSGTSKKESVAAPAPKAPVAAPSPAETSEDEAVPELEEMEDIPQLVEEVGASPNTVSATVPQNSQTYAPPPPKKRVPNRAEKKAKKTVEKLGMKSVAGIARVTLKMGGSNGFYTIFQPDVYEKNRTYVVFGEAQQGAGLMDQQQQAARAAKMLDTPVAAPTPAAVAADAAEPDGDDVDESGLDAKDIDLVVGQAGCSRSKAVSALRENGGDLVNAIMSLTT